MSVLIVFIQKAIVQGICILYGALGEIMTEKSGNLNLVFRELCIWAAFQV